MTRQTCAIVTSPTGTGKTQLVLRNLRKLVGRKFHKVLVIAPNQNVDVWVEELYKLVVIGNSAKTAERLSVEDMRLELLRRGYTSPEAVSIRHYQGRRFQQEFTALVFDEWHRLGINVFRGRRLRAIACHAKTVVFVSATPINPVRELALLEDSGREQSQRYENLLDQGTFEALEKISSLFSAGFDKNLKTDQTFRNLLKVAIPSVSFKFWQSKAEWKFPTLWEDATDRLEDFSIWKNPSRLQFLREASFEQEYYLVNHMTATEHRGDSFDLDIKAKTNQSFGSTYSSKRLFRETNHGGGDAVKWLGLHADKCQRLAILLRAVHDRNPKSKVVIFCIHQGTARGLYEYLRKHLPKALRQELIPGFRVKSVQALKHKFNETDEGRFLIGTDSLSESISLHRKCDFLIHYELPWSPLRLIQRVGRITRLRDTSSQTKAAFLAHLIVPGSVEEERVHRLLRRFEILRRRGLLPKEKLNKRSYQKFIAGVFGKGPSLVLKTWAAH